MRSWLIRSTPSRVALILGLSFFASLALAAILAFVLIRQELAVRIDRSILDTYGVIVAAYGTDDLEDLRESVESHALAAIEKDRVYLLRAGDGSLLAGNIGGAPDFTGWQTLQPSALGLPPGPAYRAYAGEVDGHHLLVGMSLAEADDVGSIVLSSLAWAGVGFVLLVAATGLAVAVRAQRRLDRIAETMQHVGRGDLHSRIPVLGRGDDIDVLSQEVNAALDRLTALVESIRQVSVDIAHELKTPLGRLGIALESAVLADERGEPVGDLLEQVRDEAGQLNATFDALLRISQIESGARKARFTAIDLMPILHNLAEAYAPVAAEAGQSLSLEATAQVGNVTGDAELLTQLLANLIENSIRHCPPATRITIAACQEGHSVAVTVADNGPGIPPEEHEKVFQRLYRLEKSRTTGGSGLGLSLVRAIADLHGARIELADNHPGLIARLTFARAEQP